MRPTARRQRALRLAGALSLAGHLGAGAVLLLARVDAPPMAAFAPEPIPVALVRPSPPPPPPPPPEVTPKADPAPPAPASPRAPPKAHVAKPAPPDVAPVVVPPVETPPPLPTLGAAELAGAATAGSGSGAGGAGSGTGAGSCDMVRRLQEALRRDPEVREAAAAAHRAAGPGRALLVWNGDWLQSPGQSGKGLAGVRQAIALEVAFAPDACRAEAMRGLVLISLADGSAAPRLALGAARWRWTDLLGAR